MSEQCDAVSEVATRVRSAVFRPLHRPTKMPQSFCHSFIVLSIIGIRCSRYAQTSWFQVCHVPTVVMVGSKPI